MVLSSPSKVSTEHRFLTLRELINLTSRSRATLYRWMADGQLPAMQRIGPKATGMRVSDYEEWASDPEAWRRNHKAAA